MVIDGWLLFFATGNHFRGNHFVKLPTQRESEIAGTAASKTVEVEILSVSGGSKFLRCKRIDHIECGDEAAIEEFILNAKIAVQVAAAAALRIGIAAETHATVHGEYA